jgi:hypothetical protein
MSQPSADPAQQRQWKMGWLNHQPGEFLFHQDGFDPGYCLKFSIK